MDGQIDDDNKKLLDLAYSGSAESAFVMMVGRSLSEAMKIHGGQDIVTSQLSYLTSSYTPAFLSDEEQDRLRIMKNLLVATMVRFRFPDHSDGDGTIQ